MAHLVQFVDHLQAVHVRHVQIEQHQVRGEILEHRRRFARIVGAVQVDEPGSLQQAFEQLDVGGLVVHDQNAGLLEGFGLHHLRRSTAHEAIESAFRTASAAGDSGHSSTGAAVYEACATVL